MQRVVVQIFPAAHGSIGRFCYGCSNFNRSYHDRNGNNLSKYAIVLSCSALHGHTRHRGDVFVRSEKYKDV